MPRAFLPLMAVAGHYGLQDPEPADNSWHECVQQLSPDRRVYGEIERRVQLRANMRLAQPNNRVILIKGIHRLEVGLMKIRPPKSVINFQINLSSSLVSMPRHGSG